MAQNANRLAQFWRSLLRSPQPRPTLADATWTVA